MGKPKQKFEVNFQTDISEQLKEMKIKQLIRLFFAILTILPISFGLMIEFNYKFILLFKSLGKALAEGMKAKNLVSPKFDNMADVSEYIENPFLFALFS